MKVDFEFTTTYGVYRDALYLADDHTLSAAEIEALKQERLDNWIYAVENPPEPPPVNTIELDGVMYEKIDVDGQIVLKPLES